MAALAPLAPEGEPNKWTRNELQVASDNSAGGVAAPLYLPATKYPPGSVPAANYGGRLRAIEVQALWMDPLQVAARAPGAGNGTPFPLVYSTRWNLYGTPSGIFQFLRQGDYSDWDIEDLTSMVSFVSDKTAAQEDALLAPTTARAKDMRLRASLQLLAAKTSADLARTAYNATGENTEERRNLLLRVNLADAELAAATAQQAANEAQERAVETVRTAYIAAAKSQQQLQRLRFPALLTGGVSLPSVAVPLFSRDEAQRGLKTYFAPTSLYGMMGGIVETITVDSDGRARRECRTEDQVNQVTGDIDEGKRVACPPRLDQSYLPIDVAVRRSPRRRSPAKRSARSPAARSARARSASRRSR